MPTVYAATLTSSSLEGPAAAATTAKDAGGFLPLSLGEIVEAKVLERPSPTQYLLSIKNCQFIADGETPLPKSATLTMRVEQLHPQIVLRIMGQEVSPATLLTDYLRFYRANPDVLMEIFQKGPEVFNQQANRPWLPESAKEALSNIQKLLESLLVSPNSLKDPLFLKNYITNLGLLLENQWQDLARQAKPVKQRPADNLKSSLLKLSEELQVLLKKDSTLSSAELPKVQQLAKFTEAAAKAIETQQMINVLSQENDSKYLLQIPLFFPTGVRTGEIIIDAGKGEKEKIGTKNKVHVVMFLNMDNLGDIMVDATLSHNRLSCVFKFADHAAQVYFSSLMDGLSAALRQAGYECDLLTCITGTDIWIDRQNYHREMFGEQDTVNLYA